jgi:HAD superfamily hydrolase (TIGR01549 family)
MHGPDIFLESSEILGKNWLSVVPEASIAASLPFVTSLHDVTEGGVGEALYEMAGASGLSIQIDPAVVPVLSTTKLLCADFGMDPFGLIGSGSLLIGCTIEGKTQLEHLLSERGIPFAWIGRAEAASEKPASTLPRFERDELLKAWLLQDLEACVFDMDGTIIDSDYDWQAIRSALGLSGVSILDDLNNLMGEEKETKWAKLHQIERDATLLACVKPGASDLLSLLASRGIKTALVTNNSAENVAYLLEKFGLAFDTIITRDSGLYKPSGAPITEAVRRLGVSLDRTLCVGDSAYDIMACRDAGCRWVCILFDETARFSPLADLDFPDIEGLIRYLKLVL